MPHPNRSLDKSDPPRETTPVDYRELPPAGPLRRFVRCYWFLTGRGGADEPAADPALPDGSPELIINLGDPFRSTSADGPGGLQPLTMLVGQITGPFTVAPTGRVDLVAARLEPFGAAGLWPQMARLTDRWADGVAIPHARLAEARETLGQATSPASRVAILDHHLLQVFAAAKQPDWRVEAAVHAIRATGGTGPLEQIAAEIGTTLRNLQRLFAVQVGISPKLLARITRFQRVFAAWRSDPASLSRVAAGCGYFDQSHLIRDFREFAGTAPAAFLASVPEFTGFFIGPDKGTR